MALNDRDLFLAIAQATEHSAELELKLTTYEQIRIVFNQRPDRHGIHRFLHTTAGNDCDHDRTRSGQTDTDPAAEAQGRKENSAEDRGVN